MFTPLLSAVPSPLTAIRDMERAFIPSAALLLKESKYNLRESPVPTVNNASYQTQFRTNHSLVISDRKFLSVYSDNYPITIVFGVFFL